MSDLSDEELHKLLGDDEEPSIELRTVKGSTASFLVHTEEEEEWWNTTFQKYMDEYRFENVADLQDLDRVLAMELLSTRYMNWLMRGTDYEGMAFDEKAIRDSKQKIDQEIRLLKKHMGMDRKGRIESDSESVDEYLKNLLRRANEFGVHRDMQNAKILDYFMELKKMIGLWERCDDQERASLKVNMDDIFEWIRNVYIPGVLELDDHFRQNQRLWIKEVS